MDKVRNKSIQIKTPEKLNPTRKEGFSTQVKILKIIAKKFPIAAPDMIIKEDRDKENQNKLDISIFQIGRDIGRLKNKGLIKQIPSKKHPINYILTDLGLTTIIENHILKMDEFIEVICNYFNSKNIQLFSKMGIKKLGISNHTSSEFIDHVFSLYENNEFRTSRDLLVKDSLRDFQNIVGNFVSNDVHNKFTIDNKRIVSFLELINDDKNIQSSKLSNSIKSILKECVGYKLIENSIQNKNHKVLLTMPGLIVLLYLYKKQLTISLFANDNTYDELERKMIIKINSLLQNQSHLLPLITSNYRLLRKYFSELIIITKLISPFIYASEFKDKMLLNSLESDIPILSLHNMEDICHTEFIKEYQSLELHLKNLIDNEGFDKVIVDYAEPIRKLYEFGSSITSSSKDMISYLAVGSHFKSIQNSNNVNNTSIQNNITFKFLISLKSVDENIVTEIILKNKNLQQLHNNYCKKILEFERQNVSSLEQMIVKEVN